jgi:sarcosine oxidase/L-pipecolate oxidase
LDRDAITPSQDWIISGHDSCDNLYIATGGSFHSWKFFPVLGKHIVAMLDGTLDAEKKARWAWTRIPDVSRGACETYRPRRDLKDILIPEMVRARV